MHHTQPRHFTPGVGMAADRRARIAARRAFVGLKLAFLDALDKLRGPEAQWLRAHVLGAEETVDLWLLRAPMFEALAAPEHRPQRQALRRALETVWPDTQPTSAFAPL